MIIQYRVEGFTAKSKKSNKYKEGTVSPEQARIAKTVLDAAFEVHSYLGPGLLESACQTCLLGELKERGVFAESEKPLPVIYKGILVDSQSLV